MMSSSTHNEEDARDGLGPSSTSSAVASESTDFSQILSQQSAADEVAEKLLREQKAKEQKKEVSSTSTTPNRRRQSKMPSLLDEDSCDFVAITATPPSSRKARLTDRQKEKLAEASAPRTTINYIDEESQSGFQKKEQLKAALSAMNFDVGEDSVSAPCLPKPSTPAKKSVEKVENSMEVDEEPEPARRVTRARKSLFDDEPKVAEASEAPEVSDDVKEEADDDVVVLEKIPKMAETTPTKRRGGGRVKKTPKHCLPDKTPPTKKRLRSSALKTKDSEDSDDVVLMSPEAKTPKKNVEAIPEASEAPEVTEVVEKKPEEAPEAIVVDLEMKDSEEGLEQSPPKTPKTPSILRMAKRGIATTPSILRQMDSPATERKRNRVHFGEESLPQEECSSPQTPRRKMVARSILPAPVGQIVLAVDVKSPQKTQKVQNPEEVEEKPSETTTDVKTTSEVDSSDNKAPEKDQPRGLLEIQDPSSSTSPFFKGLVGCNDPIDRVVRKLAPMCLKTAVDAVKRSLTQAGIKTIGDFASLSKKQVNELSGLKNPKEKCARSVLVEYEAKKRAEVRASEERILAENEEEKVEEDPKRESSPPLEPLPMFVSAPGANSKESQDTLDSQGSTDSSNTENLEAASEASEVKSSERKQLASIFDRKIVKNEVSSPKKVQMVQNPAESKEAEMERKMIEDSKLLHRITTNLSRAHSLKELPTEKWTVHQGTINIAAMSFRCIVQERGAKLSNWEDVDMDDVENAEDVQTTPEDELKALRGVSQRFGRQHTIGSIRDVVWEKVMHTINEAAILLRAIAVENK